MSLSPASSSGPAPVSWQPSGQWVGNDGFWSSYALRTGTPAQLSYVLPASASTSTWLVPPSGCKPGPRTADECPLYRGGIFDKSESSTWHEVGNYSLVIETNLDPKYDVSGNFGLETVSLGASNATGLPTLPWQVVAGVKSSAHYNGRFGLNSQASNFSGVNITDPSYQAYMQQGDLGDSHPSYLATMKNQSLIPSLSWAYTAGSYYGNSLGSLTFGGYDTSQFVPNQVDFDFAPDTARDLVVGLQSITSSTSNGSAVSLLSSPIQIFIDSTITHLYLPTDVCEAFATAFDLKWEPKFKLFLINPHTHANMTARNPNVTLTLGNSINGGPIVDIVMPYSSFNLTAMFPYVPKTMQYFPIRPAYNSTQYTLGRAFLQDAYLITNYENSNFSVSQTTYRNATRASVVPIAAAVAASATVNPPIVPTAAPIATQTATPQGGLTQTAVAGIAAGSVGALMLGLIALGLFIWRRRSRGVRSRTSSVDKSQIQHVFEKQELDGTAFVPVFTRPRSWYDYPNDQKKNWAEMMDVDVVELPDQPIVNELMSRPHKTAQPSYKSWTTRRRPASNNKKYNAYISTQRARENRLSNGKISPPISKYCRVHCGPIRDKFIDLNRTLPPTPIFRTPRNSGMRSPMPKNRRVRRNTTHKLPPR